MKNLHLLPTDKPSSLIIYNSKLKLVNYPVITPSGNQKHVYITSDEEIKEGDWVVFNELEIVKCTYSKNGEFLFSEPLTSSSNHHFSYFKKIILTTDQDLIADGIEQISEDTLLKIVEHINSGKNEDFELLSIGEKTIKLAIPMMQDKEESKQETLKLKRNKWKIQE